MMYPLLPVVVVLVAISMVPTIFSEKVEAPDQPRLALGDFTVPSWIKNNAGWWADGQIDDNSFVSGIQYLVKVGIIQVG